MRRPIAQLLLLAACSDQGPTEPPAPKKAAESGVPVPVPVPEPAPEENPKAPDPDPDPDPDPKPTPKPQPFPDGTHAQPCATPPPNMACIPGGPFTRGSDDGPEHARPAAEIWVHTFYMDVYEVTFAQYKGCQKDKRCPRSGPRYTDFDHPNMPIQGVSWFDAVAYCEAHGKRLPTEAQWEKAARGPDGALYPWGDEPATCERAILKDDSGRSCGLKKQISKPEVGRPWDVGSRPAGVYGLHDMIGNSWEWVIDWYSRSYEACGEACSGVDPRGPCDGASTCPGHHRKIIRGGSWYWDATKNTAVYRRSHHPDNNPFHHFGFRCAATVEQAAALSPKDPSP